MIQRIQMKLKRNKEEKKNVAGMGRRVYRLILFSIIYIFGAVACFAAVVLLFGTIGYIRTKTLYDKANAEYVNVVSPNAVKAKVSDNGTGLSGNSAASDINGVPGNGSLSGNSASANEPVFTRDTRSVGEIQVDMQGLRQVNKEVVGWIYFEDGLISYPILFSGDNEKYLKRNYLEKYMASGSIFLEAASAPDFSDHYTLLYGHNMRDLTMFGKLRYYKSRPGYYKYHGYFHIITADADYRYKIFSCKQVASESEIYSVIHKDKPGLEAYAKTFLIPDSVINEPTDIKDNGHVLTLSTCVSDYAYRMIVCGVREEDGQQNDPAVVVDERI